MNFEIDSDNETDMLCNSSDVIVYSDKNLCDVAFPSFERIRRQGKLCDVTLIAPDGQKFSAHRIVLAATIPYFYGMFMHDMLESSKNEITMSDLEAGALEALINYAYNGEVHITVNNVQSLLIGSSFLQLQNVRDACCQFMEDRLSAHSVIPVRHFAQGFFCASLVEATTSHLLEHFTEVSALPDFLSLTPEDLLNLAGRDEMRAESEEAVFHALMAWLRHDLPNRAKLAPQLLRCVRLPLLSPQFLHDVVSNDEVIKSSLECKDILHDAYFFLLMPERRPSLTTLCCRPRRCQDVMGVIYAVGGLTSTGDSHSIVECYDPIMRRWQVAENMATHRSRVGVAVLNGRLYAIGGYDGQNRLKTVEMFDPEQNRWCQVSPMNYQRSALGAAPLEGKLYVCGGYDGTTSMRTCEVFIPEQNKWNMIPNMIDCRSAGGLVALHSHLYAVGGHNGLAIYDSVERYDTHAGQWIMVAPMLSRRCRHGVAVLNGSIYVAGGYNGVNFLRAVEVYNVSFNQWTNVTPLSTPRSRVALTATSGNLYAIGGYDGSSNLRTVERYDDYRDEWSLAAALTAHEGGVGVGVIPSTDLPATGQPPSKQGPLTTSQSTAFTSLHRAASSSSRPNSSSSNSRPFAIPPTSLSTPANLLAPSPNSSFAIFPFISDARLRGSSTSPSPSTSSSGPHGHS